MRKYLLHVLIISFVFLLAPTVSFADADRIFKLNNKAVVVVTAYDEKGNAISQGSGFIVRRDGAVVTNYHVIGMAKDIKVKAGNKVLDVEGLIYTDKINDLAILKAKAKNMPVVKLGVVGKANVGEHVYVIGYPSGFEKTISVGLLRGIRKIDEKREILKISAPVSFGSSGSPVFNRNGEVIGVATFASINEIRNLRFAISVKLIKDNIGSKSVTAIKESGLENYINTAMYWSRLGFAYIKSGMYKEAIEAFKQAISIDPDDAMAHYNLGHAYGNLGMNKEGIEACKQAIRINPALSEAHYNLGLAYVKSGMNKEGLEAFKQAISIDPDDAMAHSNLGVAYGNLGMNKEGIMSYKQAISIDPDYAKAHSNLGAAYGNLGMYKEAIVAFKQAISIDPDDAMAHYNLGYAYGNLGMNKEGIEACKQAIRIDSDYAEAHYILGCAYGELGRYEEAIEACKQAIRIDSDYAEAHSGLGLTYGKSGMYKEAIDMFKQAIRINPNDAETHSNLGVAYLFLNDRGSALEQYKILKSLDSERANKLFNYIKQYTTSSK
jgi:tetratricopeptide (TPR) repeat protein